MPSIISVISLRKQFKVRKQNGIIKAIFKPEFSAVEAVKDISFEIKKGESVAFLGPNGAGKTTTTKMLTGLIHPTSGTIQVLSSNPFDRKDSFLRQIGLVMGNKSGLNWDLTAEQSFWLLQNIYKIPKDVFESRLQELTSLLQVTDHLKTQLRRLSLGERMKMELIGAILHGPEVLFLDEPTIGLDIVTKKNIRQFLRKIQQETGVTLVLTSHDMDDIEQVCDRVIVINKGLKVYDDSIETLTKQYRKDRYVRLVFTNDPGEKAVSAFGTVLEKKDGEYLIKVPSTKIVETLAKTSQDKNLLDVHIESIPLEEMIEDIFKKH